MSVPKKDLVSSGATKKSASAKPAQPGSLKASALTAQSMKKKKAGPIMARTAKADSYSFGA